ncbi:DsbA family protein [Arthrobacter woluwensis]|uniref:DsbA family protein n=1 Tax=Arthrobacter woluwensis TaxID=156980 RepID=UPI003805280B
MRTQKAGSTAKTLLASLALVVAAGTLGACGAPSSSNASAPSASATPSSTAPATPSAELMAKLVPSDARIIANPAKPRTTLILFTDYQCPYCAKMDTLIERAKKEYGSEVRIVVRNFPLPMHENAPLAAKAVEAAAEQGALEKMSHLVFSKQAEWAKSTSGQAETFTGYARELGLNMDRFAKDFTSPAVATRVQRDLDDAKELGLRGTPSLVLEGQLLQVDSSDYNTLKSPLDQVLGN